MTRALVVGAGSIGLRHAGVLADAGHEVALVTARDLEQQTYSEVDGAVDDFDPDYVVVATETAKHGATVASLRQSGYVGRLLVEKPLAVAEDELDGFSRVGVGYNLRFNPVIRRMAQMLEGRQLHTVEAYAGQQLSQWRPDRPTQEQYSASRARGGGVLRDLSHELDYLAWMLGPCRGVFARGGRLGAGTVDSDDAWGIVSEYSLAPIVTVQLNYLDTRSRRRIVVTTSSGTIEADVVAGVVRGPEGVEQLASERDASYAAMHAAMLSDTVDDVATPHDAVAVDAVIGMIELSNEERRWVSA